MGAGPGRKRRAHTANTSLVGIHVDGHVMEVLGDVAFVVVGDTTEFLDYETNPPQLNEILNRAGVGDGDDALIEVARANPLTARPKKIRGRLVNRATALCLGETMIIDFFKEFMGERVSVFVRKADLDAETPRVSDLQTVSF